MPKLNSEISTPAQLVFANQPSLTALSVMPCVAEVPAAEAAAAGDLPGPHDGGLHQRPHQRQVRPAADHAGAAPGHGHGEL